MANIAEQLKKFKIEQKPLGLKLKAFHGKYDDLMDALSVLANDKCITFTLDDARELGVETLELLKKGIYMKARHVKKKIGIAAKDDILYVFNR